MIKMQAVELPVLLLLLLLLQIQCNAACHCGRCCIITASAACCLIRATVAAGPVSACAGRMCMPQLLALLLLLLLVGVLGGAIMEYKASSG
jgi:hypothetical protein